MGKFALSISVHLLTASGVVFALWSFVLMQSGDAAGSLYLLATAAAIDSVDGALARLVDVKKHTPHIDGALLDNLVDYLTWTFAPLFWAWLFLDVPFAVCAVAAISSLFGFSHEQAKTEDHFFRGFPSYWNLLVFYLAVLQAAPWVSSTLIIACAILVLVPVKFIYPSRTPIWRKTTLLLAIPYSLLLVVMLIHLDETPLWVTLASFYYPVYYVVLSFMVSGRK